MEFTTVVPLHDESPKIGYGSKIFSLGSCFAENMAGKFSYFNFRNHVNPAGILFHPAAIEKFLSDSLAGRHFSKADIFQHNGLWNSFDAHSTVGDANPETVLSNLRSAAETTLTAISSASHIIITFGTAWVYRHCENGNIVANCHKVPQTQFTKELLSAEAISQSISNTIRLIKDTNPGVEIILTVSPVRHTKDGFVENQRSKAHLLAGLHHAISGISGVKYFPSYEIMMDELRDYRFYAADMIHPNQVAIDYIWERFSKAWIEEQAMPVMQEVDSIRKSISHKPFNPLTPQHQLFTEKLNTRIKALTSKYSFMRF